MVSNNKVELTNSTGHPRRYKCDSSTAIPKYTLLRLTDPRTASAQAAANEPMAGIAAEDKSATETSVVTISVWTDGVFDLTASGAIAIGQPVCSAGDGNKVQAVASAAASGAAIIGYALETASDTETINVRVRL